MVIGTHRLLKIIAASLVAAALQAMSCAQARQTHALLIGVADYAQVPNVSSLQGPANDIALMARVLREHFQVPQDHITVLLDGDASHTGLRDAFAKLAERTAPGDFVYVHFAGHGSYAPDPSDPKGVDQTWIPHGARMGKHKGPDDHDVRDKEISSWLRPVYAKTPHLVFVSDSCHSGSVSREASVSRAKGVREGPPDLREAAAEPVPLELPGDTPGVKIGAAEDTDSALEFDPDTGADCKTGGPCHGVFTWYWARALSQAQPGQTWSDVFARTYAMVTHRPDTTQRPQFSGERRQVIFGGAFTPGQPSVTVTSVDKGQQRLTIGAGSLLGLTKGSTYARARSGDPLQLDKPDAFELVSVGPFASQGRVTSGAFEVGDSARETRHAYDTPPIRLAVTGDFEHGKDEALLMRVQAALKDQPGFQLVQDAQASELMVHVLRPRCVAERCEYKPGRPRLPASFADRDAELWLTSRLEEPAGGVFRFSLAEQGEAKALDGLRARLSGLSRALAIERLESPLKAPPVQVALVHLRPDGACSKDCTFLPSDKTRTRPFRTQAVIPMPAARIDVAVGDALTFRLTNTDPLDDWHVYILDVDRQAGLVQLIFPSAGENDGAARLETGHPAWDLSRRTAFRFTAPGRDVIKVIATREPLSLDLIGNQSRGDVTPGGHNPIGRLIAASSRERHEDADPQWGTLQVEVTVAATATQGVTRP